MILCPPFSLKIRKKGGFFIGRFSKMQSYKKAEKRVYQSGFSLIELMVVIAIIAVMAGASIVSFSSLTGSRLDADARKMVADLCWARQMAVATHQDYIVDFDLVNSRYIIYRGSIAVANEVKAQNLTATLTSVLPVPAQITFLFPTGTAQTKQVNLDYQGKTKQIVAFANTGYVKIQ